MSKSERDLYKVLSRSDIAATERAKFVLQHYYSAAQVNNNEHVDAAILALAKVIGDVDSVEGMAEFLRLLESGALQPEYLLEKAGIMATVTNGDRVLKVPVPPKILDNLNPGDPVLVSIKAGTIAMKDDSPISLGCVSTVRRTLKNGTQVIIEKKGEELSYHVDAKLHGKLGAGDRILTDDGARVVVELIDKASTGEALLTSMEVLDTIDLAQICDLQPAVAEIIFRCESFVSHPEWLKALNVRPSCSYLFCGPTGTGKTMALNIIARKLADYVENLTGKRMSRLVRADTSTFFTSYFGETEQRIKAWWDGIRALGAEPILDKDGNQIKVPLLVVLEEGEALFRARGSEDASSHLFDRPLSLMLSQASSVGQEMSTPIITIMTSNRPSLMDAAALRRFGMRRIDFSGLDRKQTEAIINKKIAEYTPVREESREDHIDMICEYLFGDHPQQGIAEAKFSNGKTRVINRGDLVTPAILEESLSAATDMCLRESVKAGTLLGLSAEDVVMRLDTHFNALAKQFRAKNLEEYLPHLENEVGGKTQSVRALV